MISKASSLRSSGEKESDCGGHIAGVWTTGFVPDGKDQEKPFYLWHSFFLIYCYACLLGFGRGLRSRHPASPIPPLYLYLSCLNHSYEAPLARYRSSVSDTILRIDLPIRNVCSVIIVYAIR